MQHKRDFLSLLGKVDVNCCVRKGLSAMQVWCGMLGGGADHGGFVEVGRDPWAGSSCYVGGWEGDVWGQDGFQGDGVCQTHRGQEEEICLSVAFLVIFSFVVV